MERQSQSHDALIESGIQVENDIINKSVYEL